MNERIKKITELEKDIEKLKAEYIKTAKKLQKTENNPERLKYVVKLTRYLMLITDKQRELDILISLN